MPIYAASQYFGFGPTSNLFTILSFLKKRYPNIKIKLIRHKNTEVFYAKNYGVVDELVDKIDHNDAELILSSFDPFSIVEGWCSGIPTIFYCNLFWFWDVFDRPEVIRQYKKSLEYLRKNHTHTNTLKEFKNIFISDPHGGIFLGYLLADHSFIRKFSNLNKYLGVFRNDINFTLTRILIPKVISNVVTQSQRHILFQLVGGKNPFVTVEENEDYVRLAVKLAGSLAFVFTDIDFIVCVHPGILEDCKFHNNNISNLKIIPTMSQKDNFNSIRSALGIFTSPGLETIYEASYLNCPVFLLPEQNAGQYPNFKMLSYAGYDAPRFLIEEEFPNRDRLSGEDDAHEVYKLIKMIINNDRYFNVILERTRRFVEHILDKTTRNKFVHDTRDSIERIMGENPFDHGEEISALIAPLLYNAILGNRKNFDINTKLYDDLLTQRSLDKCVINMS